MEWVFLTVRLVYRVVRGPLLVSTRLELISVLLVITRWASVPIYCHYQ